MKKTLAISFWYFLRWVQGPSDILYGLAVTLSLGFWQPNWPMTPARWFMDYTFSQFFINNSGDFYPQIKEPNEEETEE